MKVLLEHLDLMESSAEYTETRNVSKQYYIFRNFVFHGCWFQLPHLPWLAPIEFFNKFEGDLPDNCYVPNDLPDSSFYESNELIEYHDISSIGFNGAITGDCLNDDKTKELR